MKNTNKYFVFLLIMASAILYGNLLKAQTANLSNQILVNMSINSNDTLHPFNGEVIMGMGIKGTVTLNSDTSFLRVILANALGDMYTVFETYNMLTDTNVFTVNNECEETCFLDNFSPTSLIFQVRDANLYLEKLQWSNSALTDASSLQMSAKLSKNSQKLTSVQNYIGEHNLIWTAKETDFSKQYYKTKATFWGNDYTSFGFEYYDKGIYSAYGPKDSENTINHDYVGNFDWRNRHNANKSTSPYYDNDPYGSGWLTPPKDQSGCYYLDPNSQEYVFDPDIDEPTCNEMGGTFGGPACWAFGPTAYVEALTNLYYNQHIDLDLSEQYIACEEGTMGPWFVSSAFNHYEDEGVINEECAPYIGNLQNCGDICEEPQERVWIANNINHGGLNHTDVRQYLMEKGPVNAYVMYDPWGSQSHSMELVGWGVIDEDEGKIAGIEFPINEDWYGYTYWIYKQSSGLNYGDNGFHYMMHWGGKQPYVSTVDNHVTTLSKTDADVKCYDKDWDGLYNWGIGPKPTHCPASSDIEDGDDSNAGLGELNPDGTCTIIGTYTASFENDWDNWVQIGEDDQDWRRHSGPTETNNTGPNSAQDGDYYIYTEASCNGCYPQKTFTIESPKIDLAKYCDVQIDFYYHQNTFLWNNDDHAKLALQLSYDNGVSWSSDFWYVENDQGDEWHHVTLSFPPNVNKVRFVAETGLYIYSDIALDNITIGPTPKSETPIVISDANTVWNSDATINCDIIIEDGADLKIQNCSISMHHQAKIMIKQGAKLDVDNATITSSCNTALWPGIEVWGHKNLAQNQDNQGYLHLSNATITNARYAVQLWKPNDYSATGGYIKAYNSHFTNNKRDVAFLSYHNEVAPGHFGPNQSYLYNCTFSRNANYVELPNHPTANITMWDVEGARFINCHFVNDYSTFSDVEGFFTLNAGFTVKGNTPDASNFYNYHTAISAANSSDAIYVKNVLFQNNSKAIKLNAVTDATIIFNNFFLGNPETCSLMEQPTSFGIDMNQCSGFAIEENFFTKKENNTKAIYVGIRTQDGQSKDEIYKNKFEGISYANYAVGKNYQSNYIWEGLSYFCNENTKNYADFYVEKNSNNSNGIQIFQGDNQHVSGNTFSQGNAKWHFYNAGDYTINYYYNENDPIQIPANDKIYNVSKKSKNLTNSCPSHYGGGGTDKDVVLTDSQRQEAETDYANASVDYHNVKELYANLKDGGNTEALVNEVETAWPQETWALRSKLLGDSPHLSMDVLKKAADKTEVLPESIIFEVMAANPDELKKDELIKYLKDKENPLPDYMIDILKQVASGTTYKTVLQNQMSDHKRRMTRAAQDIVRSMLNDTLALDYTQLRYWLDNLGGKRADEQIVESYLAEANYADALSWANSMPAFYKYDAQEMEAHNQYMQILNLRIDLAQNNRNVFELNTSELSLLEELANNTDATASVQAKSILEFAYDYHFCDCIQGADTTAFKSVHVIPEEATEEVFGVNLKVKPNPASVWVAFDYTLPKQESIAEIRITDVSGKVIDRFEIKGNQGQKVWDASRVEDGMYYYTLISDGKTQSGKIIISK